MVCVSTLLFAAVVEGRIWLLSILTYVSHSKVFSSSIIFVFPIPFGAFSRGLHFKHKYGIHFSWLFILRLKKGVSLNMEAGNNCTFTDDFLNLYDEEPNDYIV